MLPDYQDELQRDFELVSHTSRTYRIDLEKKRVVGTADGLEAVRQAVFLILNTERFVHGIYSWNYGAEIACLMGQAPPLVYAKIRDNVREALLQDDRIHGVENFTFQRKKNRVTVSFTVLSSLGAMEYETEVML